MNKIRAFNPLFFSLYLLTFCAVSEGFQGLVVPLNGAQNEDSAIEIALSDAFKNGSINVRINQSSILCQDLCSPSSDALFDNILKHYPDTDIVFFYDSNSSEVSSVTAIDALSMNVLTKISLPKASSVSDAQRFTDIGKLVLNAITEQQTFTSITISMFGFTIDEMTPVSGFLLSLSANNQIKLIETSQVESSFSSYIPVINTTYALSTDVPANHLINEFIRYWDLQNITVKTDYDRIQGELSLTRVGVPYWPSLLSIFLVFIVFFMLLYWFTLRRGIQSKLNELALNKKADDWLALYDKSNKPWVRLNHHWTNKASFWRQIKRESQQLEKQAKLFYDAGDTNTAKLFISKALNINASAPAANELIQKIKVEEENVELLNDKEQWIRNKIAKAMINFRNNNYYKALRQAYQAEAKCGQQKALKKQMKAINKLVNKILFQSAFSVDRVHIKLTDAIEMTSIGREDEIYIGREDTWISEQGVGVMQFIHKGLSRIGQHAKLTLSNNGLSITELGSTNGTYHNAEKLNANESILLQQDDLLQFSAKSKRQGLAQRLTNVSHASFYCFEFPIESTKADYIDDYTKVWSDYMMAANRKFIITKKPVYIHLNIARNQLHTTFEKSESKSEIALFMLSLMPYLIIEPINSNKILLNNEEVLGRTALQLPAEIAYKDVKIQILANEFSYISEYTKSTIQSELNLKDV